MNVSLRGRNILINQIIYTRQRVDQNLMMKGIFKFEQGIRVYTREIYFLTNYFKNFKTGKC